MDTINNEENFELDFLEAPRLEIYKDTFGRFNRWRSVKNKNFTRLLKRFRTITRRKEKMKEQFAFHMF